MRAQRKQRRGRGWEDRRIGLVLSHLQDDVGRIRGTDKPLHPVVLVRAACELYWPERTFVLTEEATTRLATPGLWANYVSLADLVDADSGDTALELYDALRCEESDTPWSDTPWEDFWCDPGTLDRLDAADAADPR
jgi:hypothetical protein